MCKCIGSLTLQLGHVVFVESPSGVGFSYAVDMDNDTMVPSLDFHWGDETVRVWEAICQELLNSRDNNNVWRGMSKETLQTGVLNARFVHEFFVANSELANNPWWISGESYGGVYVPRMTAMIADYLEYGAPNNTDTSNNVSFASTAFQAKCF
jgi:carboxypeptidase C (cathepsin A)